MSDATLLELREGLAALPFGANQHLGASIEAPSQPEAAELATLTD